MVETLDREETLVWTISPLPLPSPIKLCGSHAPVVIIRKHCIYLLFLLLRDALPCSSPFLLLFPVFAVLYRCSCDFDQKCPAPSFEDYYYHFPPGFYAKISGIVTEYRLVVRQASVGLS